MIKTIDRESLVQIERIEKDCFLDYYSYKTLESAYNGNSFYGIMDSDGEVKGYLLATVVLDVADLDKVAVKKEYRNQKIASNLIDEFEKSVKAKGVKEVLLEVRRSNLPAINLYKSKNYKQISERKNYYGGVEDALIFKKDL